MNIFFAVLLIFFAAFSRLIPHAPNFTPMISVALFAGVYLEKRLALAIPLLALLLSDVFLGFYGPLMAIVYGSTLLVSVFGFLMKGKVSIGRIAGTSFAGAVFFFVTTNFGVWALSGPAYPKTFAGLAECYTAAIPFFRNTLASTLIYSATLFGVYEIAAKYAWKTEVI
ncbi:MAG: DUF6580 family putative transport protein [Patescibacteria group bacterium]